MISGFVLRSFGVTAYTHVLQLGDQVIFSNARMREFSRLPIKKFVYLNNALHLDALPTIL
jgi:hypothetical protein